MLCPRRAAVTEHDACLLVDGRELRYTLRRSTRRTLAMQVDARGLRVAVPLRCAAGEVEVFVRQHAQWAFARLAALAERQQGSAFAIVDGATFPLLGHPCRVRLGGGRGARWAPAADGHDELWLPAAAADHAALLQRAVRGRALAWFGGRVAEYCHRLGVAAPPVRLSSARTRWGSCSLRSGIRLHWRLIHLPPALGDYVVAHEVAHLLEMNHSPRFWSVVESLYPDWRAARVRLRAAAAGLPLFLPGELAGPINED